MGLALTACTYLSWVYCFEFVSRKISMKKFLQNNIWLLALSLSVISVLYLSGCSNNGLLSAKGMYGAGLGPGPVDLGAAGNYVILAKSGVSTVPTSNITGNIGLSPITSTALTGFSQTNDSSNTFSTSAQVTGKIYCADYTNPTPPNLTTAVNNMMTAYTTTAGRPAKVTELGAGNIGGLTLAPGVYKWSTGLDIPTNVTLAGGPNDTWIFQVAQTLNLAAATSVILSGGARAANVVWQVGGTVTLNTTSSMQGIILAQTEIDMLAGASITGRLYAQTAVNLSSSVVTQP
jgi:hypothetical protein